MTRDERDARIALLEHKNLELQNYLNSTDYKAIRASEGGDPVDDETHNRRAECRSLINQNREDITVLRSYGFDDDAPDIPEEE